MFRKQFFTTFWHWQVKRNPFDGRSGFPSFFAAAKAPFGDSSSYKAPAPAPAQPSYSAPAPSYSAPAPAPAPSYSAPEPSYSAPEPSYSAPAPSYPSPSYHQPTHNCSIQEETQEAQVSQKNWFGDIGNSNLEFGERKTYLLDLEGNHSEPLCDLTQIAMAFSESRNVFQWTFRFGYQPLLIWNVLQINIKQTNQMKK